MLAGNETSSTALTWILYMLTQNPETQTRLREECLAVADERPSLYVIHTSRRSRTDAISEEISALPYLGAVVHEALRLLSPVQGTIREANEDIVIPLGTPVRGRDGQMMDSIKLSKGTSIFIRQYAPLPDLTKLILLQRSVLSTPPKISGARTQSLSILVGTSHRAREAATRNCKLCSTPYLAHGATS
jgi:hypothetical protein